MKTGVDHPAATSAIAPKPKPPRRHRLPRVVRWRAAVPATTAAPARWCLAELSGRLAELSGVGASAQLTMAFALVSEAQDRNEPTAWITSRRSTFFPPDAAESGVDLSALPVIFAPDASAAGRVAGRLARSGAFGLIVLDLAGMRPTRSARYATMATEIPVPLLSRLAGLAQKHDVAALCLTDKPAESPSLGALVSLRCEARREDDGRGGFLCRVRAIKDKRRGPGWSHAEVRRGPAGLC
ncbi:MAG: recombinase A [Acidobacteriota bacterium]|nr:recombinase A [Acidobacteriota bacterium]